MLDWPAFGNALWRVSDKLGIRPEWQLPVISLETAGTFDPAITNPGGCVGLNQLCPSAYSRYVNVPVDEYRSWTASRQLSGPVFNYWRDATAAYGPIRSATKLMISQLGHGILKRAQTLNSVVFSSPSNTYAANSGFDRTKKGYITVQDLANALAPRARSKAVREALGRAYAMRPSERPYNPVYGTDFGFAEAGLELLRPPIQSPSPSVGKFFTAISVLALTAGAGYGAYRARSIARRA
ncbi:hypothetical protein LCGC14_1876610 [marine sediment metagenome]|uniref:Transglycosylase SLT domain-containing protein n=1 Tax=marine sediment metagenome TaxID=412755 RepID=A0A0F9G3I2_9ZZZZ